MGKYITPEGYFNATDLIPEDADGHKILKPSHFLDNKKIQIQLTKLNKQPIIYRGRDACTFIPMELKFLFIAWLALNT